MVLEITKKFTVKAPPALVWAFLIDPNKVARCLPGAAITGQLDEKTFIGTMSVKVGPVSASYKGMIVRLLTGPAFWIGLAAGVLLDRLLFRRPL